MRFLPALLALLLAAATASADVGSYYPGQSSGSGIRGSGTYAQMTALTASPGDLWYLTDDNNTGSACDVGGGSTKLLCVYNGSGWVGAGTAASGLTNPLTSNMDVGSFDITSGTNQDVDIDPNGTGAIDLIGPVSIGGTVDMNGNDFSELDEVGTRIRYVSTEAEFEAALTAFGDGVGVVGQTAGTIYLEGGVIDITDGVTLCGTTAGTDGRNGLRIFGTGGGPSGNSINYSNAGTILRWVGTNGGDMLSIGSCNGLEIAGVVLDGRSCVDGYSSGGPPQTSGAPDGKCDSDGVTLVTQAANALQILNMSGAPAKIHMHDSTIYGFSDYAIKGNTSGQWDESTFSNMMIYDTDGVVHVQDDQSTGLYFGPNIIATQPRTGAANPAFRIEYGDAAIVSSYIGFNANGQTGIMIDATAAGALLADLKMESGTYTGITFIDADDAPTNGEMTWLDILRNQFRFGTSGQVAIDVAARGRVSIEGNTADQQNGTLDLTAPSITIDRDSGFAGNRTWLSYKGNTIQQAQTSYLHMPRPWIPTIGSGVYSSLDAIASATLPNTAEVDCIDGQMGVDIDDGSLKTCENDAWIDPPNLGAADEVSIDTTPVTAAAGIDFQGSEGILIDTTGGGDPLVAVLGFEYAGTPTLAERCVFADTGTGSGGFNCEGPTANSKEFKLTFPTYTDTGATDVEDFIVTSDLATHDANNELAMLISNCTLENDGTPIPDSCIGDGTDNTTAGTIANDPIWDVAGDLAYASGADTGARLPLGLEGQVLKVVSGALAWGTDSTGGTPSFDAIASGTNTTAAMTMGSGSTLVFNTVAGGSAGMTGTVTLAGDPALAANSIVPSTTGLLFEGTAADASEGLLVPTNPTADRTWTLPDVSGTVVTTGDTGSVTSTMVINGTIVDADVANNGMSPDKAVGDATDDTFLDVAAGGSGAGTFTADGALYGNGTGDFQVTAAHTANGSLLIGDGAGAPTVATLTGTANEITVTNGAGSITLDIPNSPVFTTPNIGAATGTSLTLSAATTPVLELDDDVASDTAVESRINGDATADDNGRIRLQVEENADGTYYTAIDVQSTAGAVTTQLGGNGGANHIKIAEGGILTGEGTATIEADALAGNIDIGTGTIRGSVPVTVTTGTTHSPACTEVRGGAHLYTSTSAVTVTLPSIATCGQGASACFYDMDGTANLIIDPGDISTGDQIRLDGALDPTKGDSIDPNTAAAGNFVCVLARDNGTSDEWIVLGKAGDWAAN